MKTSMSDEELAALRGQSWKTEDAMRVLEACKDSGMRQVEFCRQHRLQPKRLSWWRKRLRDWGALRPATKQACFAPAVVASAEAMKVKIQLPGEVAIEIADVVSASFVASLVSELREAAL